MKHPQPTDLLRPDFVDVVGATPLCPCTLLNRLNFVTTLQTATRVCWPHRAGHHQPNVFMVREGKLLTQQLQNKINMYQTMVEFHV